MPSDANNPMPKGAHRTRAIALSHQRRYDRMEAELRLELALDPEDPETLTWLALALLKLDRREEALAVVRDAIRLRPDHAGAHHVHARIHWQLLNLHEAEQAIAEALRLQPAAPEILDFLADIRREQGRLDEALALVERGLAIDPQHVNCLYNRGLILTRLGRLAEARESLLAALAVEPETAVLHRDLGRLLLRMDAVGPAVEHLREALRLEPNLEGELRPLIAEGLKRHSPWYDRIVHLATSQRLLLIVLPILVAFFWFGRDSRWPPLVVMHELLPAGIGYVLLLLSA